MKKRILILLLAMAFSLNAIACSNESVTAESSSEALVENESPGETVEYSELSIKEDWEEKATVTFSTDGMSIEGEGCSDEDGVLYITEGGSYTISGTSEETAIVINTDKNVKIILAGVDLTNTSGPVIYGEDSKNLYIELAEGTENILTDGSSYDTDENGDAVGKGVIFSNDDIIILGEGSLTINANYKHGIVSDDKIYIESGNITIESAEKDGIHANDLICIDGGSISISANSDLMQSEDMLVINAGTISGSSLDEGIEADNSLYIYGGEISITVEDDGLNAGSYIEIDGGDIDISCNTGDAIDCNGNYDGCIVINGGDIYAIGGSNPEGALDADNSAVTVNGGTLVAIGDVNSPIDTDSGQVTVVYGSFDAGETISIVDEDGNTLFSDTPTVSGTTMIISVAGLEEGETYYIYADNEISYTFTVDSQVIEAGGSDQGLGGAMGGAMGNMPEGNMNPPSDMPQMNAGEKPEMGSLDFAPTEGNDKT